MKRSYDGFLFFRLKFPCICLVVLSCLLFQRCIFAQFLTRSVNLTYLSQRSDVIVQGRVAHVTHRSLAGYPNIPTVEVTLEVENMLRGPQSRTYTFREVFLGLRAREGKDGYQIGQRLLLFLPSPSQCGLSSPVGIEQGRFHITYSSSGQEIVANELGNTGLFKNVSASVKQAGALVSSSHRRIAATKRGPVPLGDLVSLVGTLTSLPRIR